MLEGDLCHQCGEYIGRGGGFPGLCRSCARLRRTERKASTPPPHPNDKQGLAAFERKAEMQRKQHEAITCPHCGKRLKSKRGKRMHVELMHGKPDA
jgi:hypothetical protein